MSFVWDYLIFYRDVFGAFAADLAAADKRANSKAFSTAETVASRYQTLPEWMDERRGVQSDSTAESLTVMTQSSKMHWWLRDFALSPWLC